MEVVSLDVEEVGSKAVLGVEQDSVGVVVQLGGGVLDEELHLEDVLALGGGALEGGGLLGLAVVGLDPLLHVGGLDLGHVELGSEGVLTLQLLVAVRVVEQVLEGGAAQGGVLLVDLSEHHGVVAHVLLKSGLLNGVVVADLSSQLLGELRGRDEGHDVGVVREDEHLLVGGSLIISS